jgi:hypothetical protein
MNNSGAYKTLTKRSAEANAGVYAACIYWNTPNITWDKN